MFVIPKIENICYDSTEISFFIFNAVNLFYKIIINESYNSLRFHSFNKF